MTAEREKKQFSAYRICYCRVYDNTHESQKSQQEAGCVVYPGPL